VAPSDLALTRWFDEHRSFLWGLSYRITGSTADADDVLQETFIRAWKHAPEHLDDARQWLMRVAVNASRDVLRRRKRRSYIGPWLPTPIDTSSDDVPPSYEPVVEGRTLEGRYDLMESASLAFLQALDALTPTQRAVLLLCDVFDYSAGEVGAVLHVSEGNVRQIHHRARRAMESYEQRRTVPTATNVARTHKALERFLALLKDGDVGGIERMLTDDVKATTDGGGEFTAALIPIAGAEAVARLFARLAASREGRMTIAIRSINLFPTAVLDFEESQGRRPRRIALSVDVDANGLIAEVRVIVSSHKLAHLADRDGGRLMDLRAVAAPALD
jgi:RNA polymerase sigma-70 factor (ECF subfamily)